MSRGSTWLIADNELWSSEQDDELTADWGGQRGHLNHMQVTWITVFMLVYVESVLPKDPVGEVTFPDLH